MDCSSIKPSIFFVSESNIKTDSNTDVIKIDNYHLYQTQPNLNGMSRLACYVRFGSGFELKQIETYGSEILCLESDSHRFIGVYRPFTNHNNLSLTDNFHVFHEVSQGNKNGR